MGIEEILKELESLPKGYISVKTIKGKQYYYLQCLKNGKIVSTYVKRKDLDSLKGKIEKRKELERLLSEQKNSNSFKLSPRSKKLTGYLMHQDEIVAKFDNGVLDYLNEKKAPLFIARTKDLATYLSSRTLDLDRPNARFLLKQLGITDKEEYVALYAYGATIQDSFWFKPLGSRKKYADIRFDNELYADVALKGKILQLKGLTSPSPEFTNIGSFEKCWKKIDGEWWLYKAGKRDEILSEYFVYLLAHELGMPVATYALDGEYIRSKNFASKYDFEPMFSLLGDNESYDKVFEILLRYDEGIAADYIRLIWFDSIVYNVDRHNQNYGLLRDKKSGRVVSLAPNFDNNLALLAYNKTLEQNVDKDGLMKLFVSFVSSNEVAKKMFKEMALPVISEEILDCVLERIEELKEKDKIKQFVLARYEHLDKIRVNL
ncbi:MAG: HipA domain-containing protein [Bacilli bacterium]|nr:HipA domain-containing protein [Bacilli bacterium]